MQGINCLKDNGFKENENDPDALLIRSHDLTEKDFNPSLKCICRAGAGVNHIPLSMATKKGVVVFNTPGGNANAVKELVICGLLLSSRGIIQGHKFTQNIEETNSNDVTNLVESNKKMFKGIANLGYRPTFRGKKILLEVNIFNFSKNIYFRKLKVDFIRFIRGERKFKNINALKKQIDKDILVSKKELK